MGIHKRNARPVAVSYPLNGCPSDLITPKRGQRKDDLSPLLFILCMEYASRIITKVGGMDSFIIQGVKEFI